MEVYTVHVKAGADGLIDDNARAAAVFVPEGFSFWAFLFQPFWALWHRLWLVAAGILLGLILLGAIVDGMQLGAEAGFVIQILFAILVGAEAQNLRRWTLRRRGYEMRGVVAGEDLEQAERRYFGAILGV
jgi:hypothetical protein